MCIRDRDKVWIGLSDEATEGTYTWTNGDSLSYSNWYKNEPKSHNQSHSHQAGREDYTVMYKDGKWKMKDDNDHYKYVMEVPCNNSRLSVTQIAGLPSGSVFPVGVNTVTYVALDSASGLTDTCSFNVTIEADTEAPIVRCKSNRTFTLVNGTFTVSAWDIDNGSYDNCSGIASLTLVPNTFDTSNTGANAVTLIVIDSVGNIDSCHSTINIIDPNAINYCSATGNSNYEWIQEVRVGNNTNISGNNGGYGDYTATPLNVNRGSVSLKLKPGHVGRSYNEYWRVWIDYNNDGDFNDRGECVYQRKRKNTVYGSFYISNSKAAGTYTMRIGMKYGRYPNPCGYCGYGEYEDYKITIGTGSARSNGIDEIVTQFEDEEELQDVTLYPNPTKGAFNLEFEGTFDQMISIEVRSLDGKLVKKELINGSQIQNRVQLDITNQSNGIYFISIRERDFVKVIKFTKM